MLQLLITIFFVIFIRSTDSYGLENKILFKIDNEIITTIDIYEEIKFLKIFNPETRTLNNNELFEISKNSIFRDRIKKIEIMNYVEKIQVENKFLRSLIKNKYSKFNLNSIEDFESFLKDNELNVEIAKEKLTIELIWNDIIYQKFNNKVLIDEEKIRKEILENSQKEIQKELLLSEIIFNVSNNEDFKNKHKEIISDIEEIGFKKAALIHSNSDTGPNGGVVGWVLENNLNQKIKKIISKLKLGEYSEPIRISSGFIILRIDEKRNYQAKFDLDEKINEIIRYKKNNQLSQFSNMYFNKVKKNLTIYDL